MKKSTKIKLFKAQKKETIIASRIVNSIHTKNKIEYLSDFEDVDNYGKSWKIASYGLDNLATEDMVSLLSHEVNYYG